MLALLVTLGFGAASCEADAASEADLEALHRRFLAQFQELEQTLAPAQFVLPEGETDAPGPCFTQDGDEGTHYVFPEREAIGHVDNPRAIADQVAERWLAADYEVETQVVGNALAFQVVATDGRGGVMRFTAAGSGMTYSGETYCVAA